jgi:hypothetical protein
MIKEVTRHIVFRLAGVVTQASHGAPCLIPGMGELLQELSPDFTLWLFCEPVPEEPVAVLESLQLDRLISRARWLFASERFCVAMPKELIEELMVRTDGRQGELLWIDDRPAVTSAMIRAGLNAVVFVDAFRLRRNLVLRGLVQ